MKTNTAPLTEKRFAKRLPTSRPAVMMSNQSHLYTVMTDFSKHGIGLLADVSLEPGTEIEIHFDVVTEHETHNFQLKAEVKHCFHLQEPYHVQNQYHIGVQLILPSEHYLTLYDQLAAA
jgi:hypothetical protein